MTMVLPASSRISIPTSPAENSPVCFVYIDSSAGMKHGWDHLTRVMWFLLKFPMALETRTLSSFLSFFSCFFRVISFSSSSNNYFLLLSFYLRFFTRFPEPTNGLFSFSVSGKFTHMQLQAIYLLAVDLVHAHSLTRARKTRVSACAD